MSSMREKMPTVACWLDTRRRVYGEDYVNSVVRRGLNGEPVFYAQENGHTLGKLPKKTRYSVGLDKSGNTEIVHYEVKKLPQTYLFMILNTYEVIDACDSE